MSSYLIVKKESLLRLDDLLSYYSNTMSEYSGELLLQYDEWL